MTAHIGSGCQYCKYEKASTELNCVPNKEKTWQRMVKPLIGRIQVSLRALKESKKDTITSIGSLLNGTFDFIFKQNYIAPLRPYIVFNCTWCMSDNESLRDLILAEMKASILEDVHSTLQGIVNLKDQLTITYSNSPANG